MADSNHIPPTAPRSGDGTTPASEMPVLLAAINALHDIVCVFDSDDRLVACNTSGYQFLGLTPETAPGTPREKLCRACRIESAGITTDMQPTSGDILWFQKKSRYMRSVRSTVSGDGVADGLIVEQLTDVTGFVLALHAGEELDLQYRQLVENMPFGLLIAQEGRILLVNNRLCERYGVERDALEGAPITAYTELVHVDDRGILTNAMQVGKDTCCKTGRYEFRRISPPDDQGWCEMHISRIIYGGRPACQGILQDISSTKLTAKALHDTDTLLKAVFNGAQDPIFAKNRSLAFTHANPAMKRLLHVISDDFIGRTDEDLFGTPVMDRLREIDTAVLAGEIRTVSESFMIEGQEHEFQTTKVPIRDEEDNIIGLCGIARDITELQKTLTELRKSRKRYKRIFERFRDIYYETNLDGMLLEVSPSVESFSKYKREDLIGKSVLGFYQMPDTRDTLLSMLQEHGRVDDYELKLIDADGISVECSANIVMVADSEENETRIIGSIRNISGLKRVERALSKSLREKELLLREIHHRLKNNMQVISGLLTLQAQRTSDETYKKLLTESISRVNSMSLIHESLYRSSTLSEIDIHQYLGRLTRNLISLYRGDSDKVSFFIDTADIYLSMDRAIPCGLIINELVSNAFKHGFDNEAEGSILITMTPLSSSTIKLVVSHTGIGFASDVNWRELPSLGLQLVVMLAEHQLGGSIELTTPERSEFTITFQR